MSLLDRIRPRRRASAPAAALGEPQSELARNRQGLSERLAQQQFDLGGLTYEMAIRDHFRLDVLARRAAELQEVDAELGEVERLIAMEGGEPTGGCVACGAIASRGAVFCWQCGTSLMDRSPVGSSAAPAGPTASGFGAQPAEAAPRQPADLPGARPTGSHDTLVQGPRA